MVDLSISRQQIDKIDDQIVQLFEKRMEVATEVAKYKMETGKAVFDKEREDQKLDYLGSVAHGEFNEKAVRQLFSQIMSISRKHQYSMLMDQDISTGFTKTIKDFRKEAKKVMYFGVPGTHTQQAMEQIFGEEVQGISCTSFQGIMEAVQNGDADFGVLPIENSSTGGITANYDLLLNYENSIVGHYVLKIDQCLMALPGTTLDQIKKVYSHPQGLAQCAEFMREHAEYQGIEYDSTAAAAQKVAMDQDRTQAAIASRRAAKEYGLEIIADAIQHEKNNCTRFIVIGHEKIFSKESDRIALCIELPHISGSLYGILSHFMYNNLNMTLIESRPIPASNWEYRFFIDIEGNLEDAAVKNALRGIEQEATSLRILGNFKA